MASPQEGSIFQTAQQQYDQAASLLGLNPALYTLLREPLRELTVRFPVKMDDGSVQVLTGYRVQYNDARGPTKGGLRFHPSETLDTIRALAAWMTWKTALLNLPLGGAKGGVVCNPKSLSPQELERVARGYIRAIYRFLDEHTDVPAPDVYTSPQVMAWMMDEYSVLRGQHVPGVITGKPVVLGGSAGRVDATARGAVYCVKEAAQVLNIDLDGAKAAIQGYGNAGQYLHELCVSLLGMQVVAVSDSRGGIYNPAGLDPAALRHCKAETGSVVNYSEGEVITSEAPLELPVEVLFPAALEGVITGQNAEAIQARIIAEAANGPTTPDADSILYARDIYVIPDFLCNAGGVTVSYFEQVQNATNHYWSLEDVHQQLETRMRLAFQQVHQMMDERRVHPRLAAYLLAVSRVAEAVSLRGWV